MGAPAAASPEPGAPPAAVERLVVEVPVEAVLVVLVVVLVVEVVEVVDVVEVLVVVVAATPPGAPASTTIDWPRYL
jgi:hypothetical protein